MRHLPAAALFALSGLACTVDRSGAGEQSSGAIAGGSNIEEGGAGGSGGSGMMMVVGSAGVFGVGMGSTGGSSGMGNEGNEGGASMGGSAGAIEPADSGSTIIDSAVIVAPKDVANNVPEVSSVPTCSTHTGGQTFTPNGAISAHCYWPRPSKSDWQSAFDACSQEGGHLVTITSSAENTFVLKLFPNLTTNDRVWLGATDKKTDTDQSGGGPYLWVTGEPFSYTPWADNNPDGNCTATCGGRPCECQHRVCADREGIFWDRWQDESYYAVCESEP
jgi:hypothetical protein